MKLFFTILVIIIISGALFGDDYAPGSLIFKTDKKIEIISEQPLVTNIGWFNSLVAADSITALYLIGEEFIPTEYLNDYLYYEISFVSSKDIWQIIDELLINPEVIIAEPNYLMEVNTNDLLYDLQWEFDVMGMTPLLQENSIEHGSDDVIVAVLDTGIDLGHGVFNDPHDDLALNLWTDNNGNYGYNSGSLYNSYSQDIPHDYHGHGTHVSGIISAANNNSLGVASMAGGWGNTPGVKIMSISCNGTSYFINNVYTAAAMRGLIYAYHYGAKVINMSFGGTGESQSFHNYISLLYNDVFNWGVSPVMVASAGNGNNSILCYPAAWDEVIAVAATDINDKRCIWSNGDGSSYYTEVDVSAPGGYNISNPDSYGIYSTTPDNIFFWLRQFAGVNAGYDDLSGTSMASPHVAGLAALIISHYPNISNSEVKQRIVGTADDIYDVNQIYLGKLGSGRMNAYAALTEEPHPSLTLNSVLVNEHENIYVQIDQTTTIDILLKNWWEHAVDVYATVTTTDPNVTLIYENNQLVYNNIQSDEVESNINPLRIIVNGQPREIDFTLNVFADNYEKELTFKLYAQYSMTGSALTLPLNQGESIQYSSISKDINDDGYDEYIIAASTISAGRIFIVNHDLSYNVIASGAKIEISPVVGDVNSDGEYEVIVAYANRSLKVFTARGNLLHTYTISGIIQSIALEDMNSDGQLDIILSMVKYQVPPMGNYVGINGVAIINYLNHSISYLNTTNMPKKQIAVGDIIPGGNREIAVICKDRYVNQGAFVRTPISLKIIDVSNSFLMSEVVSHDLPLSGGDYGYTIISSPIIADINQDDIIEIIYGYGYGPEVRTSRSGFVVYNINEMLFFQEVSEFDFPHTFCDLIVGDFSADNLGLEILYIGYWTVDMFSSDGSLISRVLEHVPFSGYSFPIVYDAHENVTKIMRIQGGCFRGFSITDGDLEIDPIWTYYLPSNIMGSSLTRFNTNNIAFITSYGELFLIPIDINEVNTLIQYSQFRYDERHTGCYTQRIPRFIEGDLSIVNDVIIDCDIKLTTGTITINDGISLRFEPGKYLFIEDKLESIANSENFTKFKGMCHYQIRDYWGGLVFRNGSSSTLDNNIISNAEMGILYEDSGDHTLSKCLVSNNTVGLSVYNCKPVLYSSTIINNEDIGILCNHGAAAFLGPIAEGISGNNNITENDIGIFTSESVLMLKEGHNDIVNDEYNIYIDGSDSFSAQKNWWGTANETEIRELFNHPNQICYNPWDTQPNTNPIEEEFLTTFQLASIYLFNDSFSSAIPLFHVILADSLENDEDYASISALLTCYSKLDNLQTFEAFIYDMLSGNLSDELRKKYEETLAIVKRILGQYTYALNYYENIITNHTSVKDSIYAVIDIGNTYLETQTKLKGKYDNLRPKSLSAHARTTSELLKMIYSKETNTNNHTTTSILSLSQNYPNPFNTKTTICFSNPEKSKVDLAIYNIKGQKVNQLLNSSMDKGNYKIIWDGKDAKGKLVGSGVYFYKLNTPGKSIMKKCILLK